MKEKKRPIRRWSAVIHTHDGKDYQLVNVYIEAGDSITITEDFIVES